MRVHCWVCQAAARFPQQLVFLRSSPSAARLRCRERLRWVRASPTLSQRVQHGLELERSKAFAPKVRSAELSGAQSDSDLTRTRPGGDVSQINNPTIVERHVWVDLLTLWSIGPHGCLCFIDVGFILVPRRQCRPCGYYVENKGNGIPDGLIPLQTLINTFAVRSAEWDRAINQNNLICTDVRNK